MATVREQKQGQLLTVVEWLRTNARNKMFTANPSPYTPETVVNQVLDQVNLQSSVLVLFTVEFAIELNYRGISNVTVVTEDFCPETKKITDQLGYKYMLLSEVQNMKFDAIVGNPPFKNKKETGGKSSLWRKIVSRSWSLLNEDGTMAMIAPQFPNSANDLGHIFTENQTTVVWTDIAKYFPGVGSSFTAWVVVKQPKHSQTYFTDHNMYVDVTNLPLPSDLRSTSIIEKVMKHPLFECKSSPEYYHTSVADGKNDSHLYSKKTSNHPYAIRRTSGKNYTMWGAVLPTDFYEPKVVMTFSGYPYYMYHDKNDPIGTIKYQSGYILVDNSSQGQNLINLYESKLYKFVQRQMGTGGMRGSHYYQLPIMDLSKTYTDEELYQHFGLTSDEIKLINETK